MPPGGAAVRIRLGTHPSRPPVTPGPRVLGAMQVSHRRTPLPPAAVLEHSPEDKMCPRSLEPQLLLLKRRTFPLPLNPKSWH